MRSKIIAIDYDGCIALNSYPHAGDPNWAVINAAQREVAEGAKLILWTCRVGAELQVAVDACKAWGLEFDAVNENLVGNGDPRKVIAHEYWDDRAVSFAAGDLFYEKLKLDEMFTENMILPRCETEAARDAVRKGLWGAVKICVN